MVLLLTAETTDRPVWWLVSVTGVLAAATIVLVIAALRGLGQLKLGLEQLKIARRQLEDAKKDRHVQVFFDFGSP
jgi:dihydroxyacetone kinase DhaKLM complex PTS-EIIA-like component DhaM